MSFRIEYDDDQMSTLAAAEEELNKVGIHVEFKDDGLEHDGYMIYDVVKKRKMRPQVMVSTSHNIKRSAIKTATVLSTVVRNLPCLNI